MARLQLSFRHQTPRIQNVPSSSTNTEDRSNSQIPSFNRLSMNAEEIVPILASTGVLDLSDVINTGGLEGDPVCSSNSGDLFPGIYNNLPVAVKRFRFFTPPSNTSIQLLRSAAHELCAWNELQHPNILSLLGVASCRGHPALVCPWMELGNLEDYRSGQPSFDWSKMCVEIASGLAYLHSKSVVHGDLKAQNVLVSQDGTPKLVGFGNHVLQNLASHFSNTTAATLSVRWMAPEILNGTSTASSAADVYALGITMLEVITGEIPFADRSDRSVILDVALYHTTPSRPAKSILDDPTWNLLSGCWVHDQTLRPSALDIQRSLQVVRNRIDSGI